MNVQNALIISYHSSLNCGDRALLEMNIKHLKEAFNTNNISVAVNWPEESYFQQTKDFKVVTSSWDAIKIRPDYPLIRQLINTISGMNYARLFRKGVRATIPSEWKDVFFAYEKADIITSVSSTLFYSTGRFGWPFPVKTWTIELAHLFNKPFMVMPQSIGPLRWGWERTLLKSAYEKAFLILLRDQESLRLAESIGLPSSKVKFAPDPTFAYPADSTDDALLLLNRYGFNPDEPSIGITLIPWQGRWVDQEVMANYYDELEKFIKIFIQTTRGKIFLFNQVTGPTSLDDDRGAANLLINKMTVLDKNFIYVNEVLPPSLLKACYGQMDLIIATRMHSGIFALGMGVPVLYIGYLQKTRGLMEWLGLQDWVIDLKEVNHVVLLEKTYQAIHEISLRKEIIRQKLPQILTEIHNTPKLIREAYQDASRR